MTCYAGIAGLSNDINAAIAACPSKFGPTRSQGYAEPYRAPSLLFRGRIEFPASFLHPAKHDEGHPAPLRRVGRRLGHRNALLSGHAARGIPLFLAAYPLAG